MAKKIVVIPGDGIGKEITDSAVEVLKKAAEKYSLELEYEYKDAGGTAYDKFGTPLPEDTLEACKAADGVPLAVTSGIMWSRPCGLKRQSLGSVRAWGFTQTCAL